MKLYQVLLPLAATMMIAGCGNRGTAQNVVGQANRVISEVKEQAAYTAPAELKAVETTLAHMKQSFDQRDYERVVADVPQFNTRLDTLKAAMASKQSAVAAAVQEWSTLNEEVPKFVEAIQARVDSLTPSEELETAKAELETLKTTWAEATVAASAGNSIEATSKGRIVLTKAAELKNQLRMNESVATAS